MGSEWGQFLEWKYNEGLEWVDLEDELNNKMQHFTAKLNSLYKDERSLWELEDTAETVELIDADNTAESVLTFIRKSKTKRDFLIIALNLTPVERQDFAIGVPYPGSYQEVLNTEKKLNLVVLGLKIIVAVKVLISHLNSLISRYRRFYPL